MNEEEEESVENDDDLISLLEETEQEQDSEEPVVSEPEIIQNAPELPPPDLPETASPDVSSAMTELARKFGEAVDKAFSNHDIDRAKLDDVIMFLEEKVAEGGKIPAVVIEQYVNAVKTKADTNINISKLLDSIAKLLAASKNNPLIMGSDTDIGGDDVDWGQLLNED